MHEQVNVLQAVTSLRGSIYTFSDCVSGSACGDWESLSVIFLASFLIISILVTLVAHLFVRENQEDNITPLCPSLIVKGDALQFKMPVPSESDIVDVTDLSGKPIMRLAQELRDPFKPGFMGVVATVRLTCPQDILLATIVVRPAVKQGVALCGAECDIFGFLDKVSDKRYDIRHRTGHLLMALFGDFDGGEIQCVSPAGSACTFSQEGGNIVGGIEQNVDPGLVIGSLCAAHLHRNFSNCTPPHAVRDKVLTESSRSATDGECDS